MVSHRFSRPSFFSINSAVLPLRLGQKLNLIEIRFLWFSRFLALDIWSFHKWKISFNLLKQNSSEIQILTHSEGEYGWIYRKKWRSRKTMENHINILSFERWFRISCFSVKTSNERCSRFGYHGFIWDPYISVPRIFMTSQRFFLDVFIPTCRSSKALSIHIKTILVIDSIEVQNLTLINGKLSYIHTWACNSSRSTETHQKWAI